jgi:hypothetical protein
MPPPVVVTHEEVLNMGKQKGDVMRAVVERIVELVQVQAA